MAATHLSDDEDGAQVAGLDLDVSTGLLFDDAHRRRQLRRRRRSAPLAAVDERGRHGVDGRLVGSLRRAVRAAFDDDRDLHGRPKKTNKQTKRNRQESPGDRFTSTAFRNRVDVEKRFDRGIEHDRISNIQKVCVMKCRRDELEVGKRAVAIHSFIDGVTCRLNMEMKRGT